MRSYCTLFDSGFLSRGLVLYESLRDTSTDFRLAVFAFDDDCARVLGALALPGVTLVTLAEWEDPGLLAVKPTRTRAEYCWTSTSSTVLYCLEHLGWSEVTYLDADLFFFSDPEILFQEVGASSILLTRHNYAPAYDQSRLSGTYCVQFMRFVADERGFQAVRWWRERCLEWCFDRREDGKFGDQFYLEDWPRRFEGVHVLEHEGGGLAPWNLSRYRILGPLGGWQITRDSLAWDPIFYHFHGVRFFEGNLVGLDNYLLGQVAVDRIYRPYLDRLLEMNHRLAKGWPDIDWIRERPRPRGLLALMGQLKNRLFGTWNFYAWDKFLTKGALYGARD